MDRQLTVWAAPGLVLIVALIALLAGHVPRGLMPEHVERYAPPSTTTATAETPSADAAKTPAKSGGTLSDLNLPKTSAPAEQPSAAPSQPAEKPSAPSKPADAPKVAYDGPAGALTGRVVFDGAPPAGKPAFNIPENDLKLCCGDSMDASNRSLLVSGSGGIADVVVMVKAKGAEAEGGDVEVEMDQKCCRYEPHVLVVPQGATVRYKNSDATNHNVHTYSKKNKAVNSNVAAGSAMTSELKKDEAFKVGCDIHPWMSAQIFVTEYSTTALTDADGNFRIEGIPPGEWTVELWHESLGKSKEKVVVEPDGTATVEWLLE